MGLLFSMKEYNLNVTAWVDGQNKDEARSSFERFLERNNQNNISVDDGVVESTPDGYAVVFSKTFKASSWKEACFDMIYYSNQFGTFSQLQCLDHARFMMTLSSNYFFSTAKYFRLEAVNPEESDMMDLDYSDRQALVLARHYCMDHGIQCVFTKDIRQKIKKRNRHYRVEVVFLQHASAELSGGCMSPRDVRFWVDLETNQVEQIPQI